jgi:hypothetical protein
MMLTKLSRLWLAASLTLAAIFQTPAWADRSPIFGGATIEAISQEAARDITARGELANYFGGLAVSYAYTAYIFAFYARYYSVSNSVQEQSWYGAAAYYAYYAYIFSAWAQHYSLSGT